jgi:hypothetical protein
MSSTNFVNNNGGRSPKINGDVQRDWYYCNNDTITTTSGAVVTVPDMRGCVIVGGRPNDNVISGGDHEISDAIPIPYHNHGLQASSGQGSFQTGQESGGGNFDPYDNDGWMDGKDYGHGHNISCTVDYNAEKVENSSKEKNVISTITAAARVGGHVLGGHKHSHSGTVACGTTEYETQYAGGTDDDDDPQKTFMYYKLYYIIYLP